MPDVLIRNVDDAVVERLKIRAKEKHRSLQAELHLILNQAAHQLHAAELKARAAVLRERLAATAHADSTLSLREDRER